MKLSKLSHLVTLATLAQLAIACGGSPSAPASSPTATTADHIIVPSQEADSDTETRSTTQTCVAGNQTYVAAVKTSAAYQLKGLSIPAGAFVSFQEPIGCEDQDFSRIKHIVLPGTASVSINVKDISVSCTALGFDSSSSTVSLCQLASDWVHNNQQFRAGDTISITTYSF